jgi:hypothetical protein
MKKMCLLFAFGWSVSFGFGQSTIQGFTISPANPTNEDTIYVYADFAFPSGDCEQDFQSHQLNGTTIQAASHYCLGMLTVICYATDTFKIDPLPAGNYDFVLTLTSGGGPVPCTPGIAVDDIDTLSFTVTDIAGVEGLMPGIKLIYPNPTEDFINLGAIGDDIMNVKVFSLSGYNVDVIIENNRLDVSRLSSGEYYLRIEDSDGARTYRFNKE